MHGYAKIKQVYASRSKSADFSDLLSFPHTHKTNENVSPHHVSEADETKQRDSPKAENLGSADVDGQFASDGDGHEKKSNSVKLSRNFSVSSSTAASQRFRLDRQSSSKKAIQSAVKRAFSVSRSSSVSERYSRIHDQYENDQDGINMGNDDDDDGDVMQTRSVKKKKQQQQKSNGGRRILKACKRLFGF